MNNLEDNYKIHLMDKLEIVKETYKERMKRYKN